MPESNPQQSNLPEVEVLTLAEATAFLRASEEAVLELVDQGDLPAQLVGGEWRFLKRALVEFLWFGPHLSREFRLFPPPWIAHPSWETMLSALEQRILSKLPTPERPSPKPGSKEAVLRHFGVFKDDGDLEEQLAQMLQ